MRDLLRIDDCLGRHRHEKQLNTEVVELPLEVLDGRQRIGILGTPRPGDHCRLRAPEAPHTDVPQLRAEEQPPIEPSHANPLRGFGVARQSTQFGAERADQVVDVRPTAPCVPHGRRQDGHRGDGDALVPRSVAQGDILTCAHVVLPPADVLSPSG